MTQEMPSSLAALVRRHAPRGRHADDATELLGALTTAGRLVALVLEHLDNHPADARDAVFAHLAAIAVDDQTQLATAVEAQLIRALLEHGTAVVIDNTACTPRRVLAMICEEAASHEVLPAGLQPMSRALQRALDNAAAPDHLMWSFREPTDGAVGRLVAWRVRVRTIAGGPPAEEEALARARYMCDLDAGRLRRLAGDVTRLPVPEGPLPLSARDIARRYDAVAWLTTHGTRPFAGARICTSFGLACEAGLISDMEYLLWWLLLGPAWWLEVKDS